jgi:hypothetical protein
MMPRPALVVARVPAAATMRARRGHYACCLCPNSAVCEPSVWSPLQRQLHPSRSGRLLAARGPGPWAAKQARARRSGESSRN